MKVAVIGVGGSGSAALRFLAQAGHEVTGFEQFRIGHERGSSHGETRIIRYTYADSLYTHLMGDAYPLWQDLERQAQETLFVRCGCLYLGPEDHPDLVAIEEALSACGRTYERLSAGQTAVRFPAFRLGRDEAAIFQPDGGYLRAGACVAANVRIAARHGASLFEETPVESLEPEAGGGVRLRVTGRPEARFDAAILTAGPWIGKLLATLELPLRVTRQEVVYLRIARHTELFEPDRFPVWIDAKTLDYGFPSDGRTPGVKISLHRPGEAWDPDRAHRPVDERFIRERLAYAAQRFPDLSGEITHSQLCLYTNSPDEDFVFGRVPGFTNLWLVSACSGHGFKFTVLFGKIAADLATGRGSAHDLTRFALSRFGHPFKL